LPENDVSNYEEVIEETKIYEQILENNEIDEISIERFNLV